MPTLDESATYASRERDRATAWKLTSAALPAHARQPAQYVDKGGHQGGDAHGFCLPAEQAALNLLPEVRDLALALFEELAIPWHAGTAGGPTNHLLSSQVQCVNALGQAVLDPRPLKAAFGDLLSIEEVLQVESGRYLTFAFIGPDDVFGEVPDGARVRGAHCTSLDAAFLHAARDGARELVLLQWKYTESSLRPRPPQPVKDAVRASRYAAALALPDSPIHHDLVPFGDLLVEPLYQRVRQQLLAAELERRRVLGADRVRVLGVSPAGNLDLQRSLLRPSVQRLGSTVNQAWQQLLARPDRYTSIDSAVFLDPTVTSSEYCVRYGTGEPPSTHEVVGSRADLVRLTGHEQAAGLEDWLDFDGSVLEELDGVELQLGRIGVALSYPFHLGDLSLLAAELEQDADVTCPRCFVALRPVVYGYPGPELIQAAERLEVTLGGCTTPSEPLHAACPLCSWPQPEAF